MADLSEEEFETVMASLQKLGVDPDVRSGVELKQWMESHSTVPTQVKTEEVPYASFRHNPTEPLQSFKSLSVRQTPRVSSFSGDPAAKGEASFDIWQYEVERLLQDETHPREDVIQAIHRSLRGNAARVVMRLGPSASISRIFEKLKSIFKPSEAGETLLAQFYSARQGPSEDVTTWGCRLEDLLYDVKSQGFLKDMDGDQMLRNVFWMGLRQELKDISGHKFDTITDFDRLRVEIRRIEYGREVRMKEFKTQPQKTSSAAPAKQAIATPTAENSEISELKGILFKLSAKMDNLEHRLPPAPPRISGAMQGLDFAPEGEVEHLPHRPQRREERCCYNCGQPGHLQIGCLIRTDHRRGYLNRRGPMSRGRR